MKQAWTNITEKLALLTQHPVTALAALFWVVFLVWIAATFLTFIGALLGLLWLMIEAGVRFGVFGFLALVLTGLYLLFYVLLRWERGS